MKSFQNSYGASMMENVAQQQGPKKPKREEPAQSSKLVINGLRWSSRKFDKRADR